MIRRTVVISILWLLSLPYAVSAQLADAGKNDQHVSLFFLRSDQNDDWVGGVASKGDRKLDPHERFKFSWQLDYGSLGEKRVSPTPTEAAKEAAISKNSGVYTLSYVRRFGGNWRISVDGGVEHKRVAGDNDDAAGVQHSSDAIVAGAIRNIGARFLGTDPDPDNAPELAWSLQTTVANASAIVPAGAQRAFFFDPVGVVWLSVLPTSTSTSATAEARLFYRVQLRGEAAVMRGLNNNVGVEGHWDTSVVYFFSPANGIMLRRFDGYFDHNLRDRKSATTLNLLWKFN